MKKLLKAAIFPLFLILNLFFAGCLEKNTEDPVEAYRLWSGQKPSKNVYLIRAKYWQSAHFTKEYIMYLELIASPNWRKEFIEQNVLIRDTSEIQVPSDAPSWFRPTDKFRVWRQTEFDQGSTYFEDTISGKLFIYEIQL